MPRPGRGGWLLLAALWLVIWCNVPDLALGTAGSILFLLSQRTPSWLQAPLRPAR